MAPEAGPGRVAIVDANSKIAAHQKALVLGLPLEGDELLIIEIPDGEEELGLPRDRVLTQEELSGVGAESPNAFTDAEYDLMMLKERLG